MQALVNGDPTELQARVTIASLVSELVGSDNQRGIAVARNGEVVPRAEWDTQVEEGDEIEIVKAVQGG